MLARLLLLFTIVPIIELSLLLQLGRDDVLGFTPTLALILTTAISGAILGRIQGLQAWGRIQEELKTGQIPGDSLMDGVAVLIASAFLVTPGVLTDIAGFSLLIPFTRAPIKRFVRGRMNKWMADSQHSSLSFSTFEGPDPYAGYHDDVITMSEDSLQTRDKDMDADVGAPEREANKSVEAHTRA
ncbi:MAG: FxsA family protein [Myxococcota bacterium]